jgi:uncharacterized membrane protein YedE/YeeE
VLGLATGALLQRTHWCAMGAIADWTLFGSRRRLRAWALAVALAILGSQLLALAELVPITDSLYLQPPLPALALVTGGVAFGFGMVLTGGCVSRSMARAGSGSLRSLLVLLVVALAAQATLTGILALPAALLRAAAAVEPIPPGIPEALTSALPVGPWHVRLIVTLTVALALFIWVFRDPALRRPGPELVTGLGLGLLVVAGWAATGLAAADPFANMRPASLAYVGPTAQAFIWLLTGGGSLPGFGAALALGTLAGAFLASCACGSFRIETFVDAADLRRHLLGGVLMGIGGTLALGCTVGQGLSGLSTLSFGSLLAVAGIVLGARWALRWLETGRLLPALPSTSWRSPLAPRVHRRNGDLR